MNDNQQIEIRTELIPDAVRDRLAIATMQFIRSVLADPQQRAVLEGRTKTSETL